MSLAGGSDSPKDMITLLKGVINLLPNPVYIKDRNHVWVEVNDAFCGFLGRTRDELIGKSDFDYSEPEKAEIYWQRDDLVLTTRKDDINIEVVDNSAGDPRWVESRKSYYEGSDGQPYIIGVVTDITDMKKREEELRQAEQKAIHASKSKSEFLANMSHEIRTPMNGVLGMAQILRHTPLTDEQENIVSTLERSGEALLTIINDILDFSKMEAGKLQIDPAPFNPAIAVEDVIALLSNTANDKGIELVVKLQPDLPRMLLGDVGRIRQILVNLIGNAIKFTEQGYVLVTVTSDVSDNICRFTVQVEDTGIGIPEDKIGKIFNQFEQGDGTTTRRFGGTGLGLAISRNLVAAMGGDLTATSVHGKGSTFSFTIDLPVEDAEQAVELPLDAAVSMCDKRVLIVDDLDVNRSILDAQVNVLGAQVQLATDARDAARHLTAALKSGEPFDVMITDYQMPEIDGLRLVKTLRKNPAFNSLRIVVLSSVDSPDTKEAFEAAGVAAYLVKPVRSGGLARALTEVIAGPDYVPGSASSRGVPRRNHHRTRLPTGNAHRILIAEDNGVNRKVVEKLLAPLGYKLDFAEDGQIAVNLFKRQEYDLVLMDISMPIMDGVLATKAIRAFENQNNSVPTPIIALTAHALPTEREQFLEAGMDDLVSKPVKFEILEEAVLQWIAHHDKLKSA